MFNRSYIFLYTHIHADYDIDDNKGFIVETKLYIVI
jgi:hypothetical protein